MKKQNEWWPVALSRELDRAVRRQQPLPRSIDDTRIVLFRDATGQVAALLDVCPHRRVPLSSGKLCGGEIECCYHGWRFDKGGICTRVPGMELPTQTKALAQALSVAEEEGLIWVSLEPISPRPKVTFPNKEMLSLDSFFITGTAHCDIEEAAENFLDGFHTHFVHSGLVRTDQRRQVIRATVSRIDNGVEARYEGEGRQTGIVSQIFESDRAWSAGRFYYPGLAEVEYHSSKGLTLRVSAWLVPVSTGTLGLFARVSTRRGALPQWAKKAVLRPLFTRILNQDKQILELQHRNQKHFPAIRALDSKLDLLGPSIRALLAGEPIPDDAERTITVAL